ncbi:hypothetical protein K432DRAFT_384730 [Lepidopterella palustris CBS 459.81]|uniref:DASH complex subunit DAD1 n=1 Tax=Lepidopterella palustris CBS 459.81 TaxID=1314670 RepID=A0A8E2E4U7_9PEZI|nr:hypothetical protein K432DRAFT_384730 [Lepidopterella palustris CBS 459.81]
MASSTSRPAGLASANGNAAGGPVERTYFEQQREMLVGEIAQSLEHVLQNINRLNRTLEEVIAVGNEFSPVEALWSQFENVMAKDPNAASEEQDNEDETEEGETMMKQEDK